MEGERKGVRRFVRLPEDCVSLCAENLGIQASREVTGALVEDTSFRIRQVTQVSGVSGGGVLLTDQLLPAVGAGVHETLKQEETVQRRL